MKKLYRSQQGIILEEDGVLRLLRGLSWDEVFTCVNLNKTLDDARAGSSLLESLPALLAPIQSQEVWAAGVTYYRSREARRNESKESGGGSFYDRVYEAERPELFFKSTPHRVAGHLQEIKIRGDSTWNVPEPELTLALNSSGEIFGYTCGNDVSSRSIEGENPLYLPQAKIYDKSCALGPCLLLTDAPLSTDTKISLSIVRDGAEVFQGETTLAAIKRTFSELASFLFRENSFPSGCFLLTGTGIVPEDSFTLRPGDICHITIGQIGTLTNIVAQANASSPA